jgi:selenocysteine lyase/cysteine desulfurase
LGEPTELITFPEILCILSTAKNNCHQFKTPAQNSYHISISYFKRDEARKILRGAVGADEDDAVIFYGSGTTGCIHKLVHSVVVPGEKPPIVFVGPYEHHSNLLPWREVGAEVINVPETKYGFLDYKYLKYELKKIKSKDRLILGCFSAGSNVTGALTDDVAFTVLLHKYGGLAFWDYAAAAPHVNISMNPKCGDAKTTQLARKDAIYFSGHKFVGGPQTNRLKFIKLQSMAQSISTALH